MHSVLLAAALALYSLGLVHAVLSVYKKQPSFFKGGILAVAAGWICHATSIVIRAAHLRYLPLTQPSDTFSLLGALGVLAFFVAYAKYRITSLSVFVFPLIFLTTFIGAVWGEPTQSVPEVLRSNWIYIHTPLVVLSYVALFIGFTAAVMYLIQERELKSKRGFGLWKALPSLEDCDDLAYKSLAIGFPLITLGIVSGALWAQTAWGSIWGRDLKVVLSFLTWFIYLLLIHYRLIAGWRGRRAAYLSIAGFISLVVSFVGANYFGGLHSFTP